LDFIERTGNRIGIHRGIENAKINPATNTDEEMAPGAHYRHACPPLSRAPRI